MKKFSQILPKRSEGPLFGLGTSPQADWKIIFFSALALLVVVSLVNVVIFVRIKNGDIFYGSDAATSSAPTLSVVKLKSTVEYYRNKARDFAAIGSGTSTQVVDPSI